MRKKKWKGEGSAKREAKRLARIAGRAKRLSICENNAGQRCRTKLKHHLGSESAYQKKLDACYVRVEKACARKRT
jgi:hypothetical protein